MVNALFNDLMQAERFLINVRHRLRALGQGDEVPHILPNNGMDTVTLDWVADNPLTDFITYRRFKKLVPKLAELRKTVATLSSALGHAA